MIETRVVSKTEYRSRSHEGTEALLRAPGLRARAKPKRSKQRLRSHDCARSEAMNIDQRVARLDKRLKALLRDLKKSR